MYVMQFHVIIFTWHQRPKHWKQSMNPRTWHVVRWFHAFVFHNLFRPLPTLLFPWTKQRSLEVVAGSHAPKPQVSDLGELPDSSWNKHSQFFPSSNFQTSDEVSPSLKQIPEWQQQTGAANKIWKQTTTSQDAKRNMVAALVLWHNKKW